MVIKNIYYYLKPFIPRSVQIVLRRKLIQRKRLTCANTWPIDEKAAGAPDVFSGWPEKKQFALILTHDVETAYGQEKCQELMELEKVLGFKSSFSFVPERYNVSSELRQYLVNNGFEVVAHGLCHDGKLYKTKKIFQERAIKINHYLKEWDAVGFRSPAMHRNLEWIHNLNIEYDSSTFDTDPFEPHSKGVGAIFPFWLPNNSYGKGYVEMPYTLPQDFTLFVLLEENNIDIWKRKLDWIAINGGMALLNVHPDYMNFGKGSSIEEYPKEYYIEFLNYINERYSGQYWHALPRELACFWRQMIKVEC